MKKIFLTLFLAHFTFCHGSLVPPGLTIKEPKKESTTLRSFEHFTQLPEKAPQESETVDETETTRANDPSKISGKNIKKYLLGFLDEMCHEIGTSPHHVSGKFCAEYEGRCDYVLAKLNCIMEKYERDYVSPEEIEQEARQTMDTFFQRVRFANINKLAKEMMQQHKTKSAKRSDPTTCSKFEYDEKTGQELARYLK